MRTLLLTITLLALSSCSQATGTSVNLTDDHSYDPTTLTVQVGTSVSWENESSEAHSVTAYQASLPSGAKYFSSGGYPSEKVARAHIAPLMTNGDVFSFTFDEPGTYEYFCIPHEDQGMKGRIVVEN